MDIFYRKISFKCISYQNKTTFYKQEPGPWICVCLCVCVWFYAVSRCIKRFENISNDGTHLCVCGVQFFAAPWTVAHQTPLSMEFSRQEYWSELPLSTPGDVPNPGVEPTSLKSPALAGGFFTTSTTWWDVKLKAQAEVSGKTSVFVFKAFNWLSGAHPSLGE